MAKFDVHQRAGSRELMLECQSDLFAQFPTRFVVPLLPAGDLATTVPQLNPIFEIDDEQFVMATQLALSVTVTELGRRRTSLAEHEYAIGRAIDVLLGGV